MKDQRLKFSWPPLLCLLMGITTAVIGRFALELPVVYFDWLNSRPDIARVFRAEGIDSLVWTTTLVGLAGTLILTLVAYLGIFFRTRFTLGLYRKACLFSYATAWMYGVAVVRATQTLMVREFKVDDQLADPYNVFLWRWTLLWPVLLACVLIAYFYILAWRRVAIRSWHGGVETGPAMGDRFLENLRTHGRDPRYRKSIWSSLSFHLFIIFILPWLLTFFGCVNPYRVPKGSGTPETQGQKVVMKKVKKKKKRIIVNPHSPISFHFPDLDDSKIAEEVEKESRLTYSADPSRVFQGTGTKGIGTGKGKLGVGGGKEGGWPDGMENSLVRFIRMKYDGSGWEDGMDSVSRADINFLDYFRELTGFKTARTSESHGMALLARYPKGYAPPFVYMTGDGDIRVSDREVRIMREYLMGGGMLFADCGSPQWNASFRSFIKRVFPGESLLTISDDDVIFQLPFAFVNGAPPIWHHGGYEAMGIKYKGRWVVFYHPGDINDAWKNNRGGLTPKMAEGAMEMGVNIIYYSFTNYLELTRKYRR